VQLRVGKGTNHLRKKEDAHRFATVECNFRKRLSEEKNSIKVNKNKMTLVVCILNP